MGVQVQVLSSVPSIMENTLKNITFGTSGHRGIIGTSFTTQHIVSIAIAIARYFKAHGIDHPKVLVGYDTRAGNSPRLDENTYTYGLTQTLIKYKIQVDFCDSFAPTPLISWAVKEHDYHLGIILTASHNPPNYNGIKINDSNGAPASVEITHWIQREANALFDSADVTQISLPKKPVNKINYNQGFVDQLQKIVKQTFQLPFSDFSDEYVIDPKCGSAIHIWKLLTASAIGTIHWKNDRFSSDFNFEIPNPTSKDTIKTLGTLCKEKQCVAFSNDPDADRHAMVDELGNSVSPEKIAGIIIHYCMKNGISIASVATSLANSTLVKKICTHHDIQCHETNIGFKYFTPFLLNSNNQNKLTLGIESSGGFSVSPHTFDKCGFLPILLILGIMKKTTTKLHELSKEIDEQFSEFTFVEDALELPNTSDLDIKERLSIKKPTLDRLFNLDIATINYNDGLKITFPNDDWVLCRPSGTEPLVRIYAESNNKDTANYYIHQIKGLFSKSPLLG